MITADDNRSTEFAGSDHIVQFQAGFCPFAVAQPANTGRQALKLHLFLCHRQPFCQMVVLREEIHYRLVRFIDVFFVARKCDPPKWALALAKQRANECGYEAGIIERVSHTVVESTLAEIISVIENY